MLGIFALLANAGFRVVARSKVLFVQLAAGAATIWLTVQTLVNIGAVIELVPITGIPLPLISYSGSALVLNQITVGMLISLARNNIRVRCDPVGVQMQRERHGPKEAAGSEYPSSSGVRARRIRG